MRNGIGVPWVAGTDESATGCQPRSRTVGTHGAAGMTATTTRTTRTPQSGEVGLSHCHHSRILPTMLRPMFAVLSFVLATTPAQAPKLPTEPAGQIVWHQDFATARTIAQSTGAPLFVTFRCEA